MGKKKGKYTIKSGAGGSNWGTIEADPDDIDDIIKKVGPIALKTRQIIFAELVSVEEDEDDDC